ncbi:PREDICTED: uncharacterized protein LOC101294803 [Fragaria vesca subsp. vesca]|uniref:uncharacterized protein LOC101294803 n=1 Tax=Fragaria vesca subsp. vesca TaxID=101020 RepID=UPI0002C3510F|nr:PREDICTED: uncharacterized protein LOC101294803 [Fragaria vesca subsp. vesca]
MRREEKRRKFNEAVLNTLFPPPSPSPKDEDVPFNVSRQDIELETGSSATSGDEDDDSEGETQKLTRAQRKRMRKKKLKEDASRRKQIIGPLLPSKIGEGENCTPDARRNASEEPSDEPIQPGCSNQKNKVKQRRKAKKLAREREQH